MLGSMLARGRILAAIDLAGSLPGNCMVVASSDRRTGSADRIAARADPNPMLTPVEGSAMAQTERPMECCDFVLTQRRRRNCGT